MSVIFAGVKCDPMAGDDESRHVAAGIGLLAARNYLTLGAGGGGDRSPPGSPVFDDEADPTTTTMTPNYSVPPELLSIYVPGYRSREAGDTSGSETGSYCSINEFYSRGGELYGGSDDGSGIRYPNGPSPQWWMNHHLICKRRMRPLHARLPNEKHDQCTPCPPTAGSGSGSSVSAGSSGSTPQEWNYGISSDDSVHSASPPDSLDGVCCHEWPHDEHGDHIAGSDHNEWNSDASNCSDDSVQILSLFSSSSDEDDIQELSRSGPCAGKGFGAVPKRRRQRSPRVTKKRRANQVRVCCRDPKAKSTSAGMVAEICCTMPISGPRTSTKASNIMRSSMLKTLTDGIASPVPYNRGIYDQPGHTVAFREPSHKSGIPSSIILGIPAVDGVGFSSEACFRRKLTDAEIAADGVSSAVPSARHVHDFCTLLADNDSSIDLFCRFPPDLPFASRRYNFVSVLCIDPVGGFELEKVQVANDSSTGFYCAPVRQTEAEVKSRAKRFAWHWVLTGFSWLVTTIALASADSGSSPKVILQQDDGYKCPENFILIKLNLVKN